MRLLPLALAALPLPALADTYTVTSVPTAVTVYNGFAMVTRDVSVDVVAGVHEVILPDLPQWVDSGSLRVALNGAALSGTRLRTNALPPQPDGDSAEVVAAKAQIDLAKRALRNLGDTGQDASLAAVAAQEKLAFLKALTNSETLPSTPQALAELGEMIETQALAALQAQVAAQRAARAIEEGRIDLDEDLADAEAALAALTPPAEPKALLALSVMAEEAGTVVATVSYPARATWQPTYDIALVRNGDKTMTLRRAALITQNSGENWEDVTLTLSTLAPSGQVVPSDLYPPLVRYEDKDLQKRLERTVSSVTADSMVGAMAAPEAMMDQSMAAQPNFDGPGVTYTLTNTLSIAQNAEGVRVELDALEFEARVFGRAVPARDQTAFLMAEAVNATKEPLLAARSAQLFVDGALVGQSSFGGVPAGGEITQAFGPIEALRLSHVLLDRSEGDRGFISRSNARTQDTRITIENIGNEAWEVELLEAIPYSEQDDLEIDWSAKPTVTAQDVQDRRGLMQWDLTVKAGTSQDVEIEQTIRWPDGKLLR